MTSYFLIFYNPVSRGNAEQFFGRVINAINICVRKLQNLIFISLVTLGSSQAVAGWRDWVPALPYTDKAGIESDLQDTLKFAEQCRWVSCNRPPRFLKPGYIVPSCGKYIETRDYYRTRMKRTNRNIITQDIEDMINDYSWKIDVARSTICD